MLSDLNSETRFGILSSFRNFLAPIYNDLHILIVRPTIAFHFKNDFWERSSRRFSVKRVIPCYSEWKATWESTRRPKKNGKVRKMKHPTAQSATRLKPSVKGARTPRLMARRSISASGSPAILNNTCGQTCSTPWGVLSLNVNSDKT